MKSHQTTFTWAIMLVTVLMVLPRTSEGTCNCKDGYNLPYVLPMLKRCPMKAAPNGTMVQTIPKLIRRSPQFARCERTRGGIPPGERICRIPDCLKEPCQNGGLCEETMEKYRCNCSTTGFTGKNCEIAMVASTTETTTSTGRPTTTDNATITQTPPTTETTASTDSPTTTNNAPTKQAPSTTQTTASMDPPATTNNVPATQTPSTTEATASTDLATATDNATTTQTPITEAITSTDSPTPTDNASTTHAPSTILTTTSMDLPTTTHNASTTQSPSTKDIITTTDLPTTNRNASTTPEPSTTKTTASMGLLTTTNNAPTTQTPSTKENNASTDPPATTYKVPTTQAPSTSEIITSTDSPTTTHNESTSDVPSSQTPTTTVEDSTPAPQCPNGWTLWNETCYQLSAGGQDMSWVEHKRACADEEATMVVIDSAEENEFIKNTFRQVQLQGTWLGCTNGNTPGQWHCLDSTATWSRTGSVGYWNWQTWSWAQPGEDQDRHVCALMEWYGKWWDWPCSSQHHSVCEKAL